LKIQEFKINLPNGNEAIVKVKIRGWLRKKREVEYYLAHLPRELRREAYATLTKHVNEKLKKRPFVFHIHLPSPREVLA
jgi:hypothetical protein